MAERRRVLVVDDDATIREALAIVLAEEGYEVRVAEDGRAALEVLRDWRPDVILLDLMMPVMDGWTFHQEQRRLENAADVPVIVLSGARDARASAEQVGAVAAIAKPFDLDVLLARVAWAVSLPPRTATLMPLET